ncbi:beta-1,4-mannosyltransferase egh-like [Liolophura sinensis]|uniref:beta-1,4-mannosyltransferase egh-like n=1 Tax=Liolophura sinensis TaxID=3198878 RepID=UPI0031587643
MTARRVDLRLLFLRMIGIAMYIIMLKLPQIKFFKWHEYSPKESESLWIQLIVTISRFSIIITTFPFAVLNFAGLVTLCFFPTRHTKPKYSPLLAPFICFRVVTRGLFPELVQQNVEKNRETCLKSGLAKFMFEVVTDRPIYLLENKFTLEQVVPPYYQTPNNSLFKARALHYCNEPEINQLGPNDWIVHLDEETVLTEDSVIGILNFVSSGDADFGQGAITYASGHVVNWVTTLIDGFRVGIDYCYLRFSLKVLQRPIFNWKGSYMVARAGAEHDVSFDNGVEGSIAEDCFFGAVACSKGYRFGFIEGEMLEESVYTFADFIRQRKRWNKGIYLTARSPNIPIRHKIGILLMSFAALFLPFIVFGVVLDTLSNVPSLQITELILRFVRVFYTYLFVFGNYNNLNRSRFHLVHRVCISILSILVQPVCAVLECIASLCNTLTLNDIDFYIVQKSPELCLKDSGAFV